LLFLALLPQFTDPNAGWPLSVQIVVLGLVHVASCAVIYTGVGTGARRGAAGAVRHSAYGDPLLWCRDGRDRRGAAGRATDRLTAGPDRGSLVAAGQQTLICVQESAEQ
jgi:hypothetical protein